MQATFRQSKLNKILSQIIGEENMKELMEEIGSMKKDGNFAKELFFNSLTPIGKEAFKLGYQIIENELYVLKEHDCEEIAENWFLYFIESHDEIISMLKDGEDIFKYAIDEYGDDYVNDIFRQDTRSLSELMDIVGESFIEATKLKSKYDDSLKEKLHNQLHDVVTTLKELTVTDGGVKHFEIEVEGAQFEITINDTDSKEEDDSEENNELEDLIKFLKNKIAQDN